MRCSKCSHISEYAALSALLLLALYSPQRITQSLLSNTTNHQRHQPRRGLCHARARIGYRVLDYPADQLCPRRDHDLRRLRHLFSARLGRAASGGAHRWLGYCGRHRARYGALGLSRHARRRSSLAADHQLRRFGNIESAVSKRHLVAPRADKAALILVGHLRNCQHNHRRRPHRIGNRLAAGVGWPDLRAAPHRRRLGDARCRRRH